MKILITGIVSTLLLTNTLTAHSSGCKNGKCFIDISKLSPSKTAESKVTTFKTIKKIKFTKATESSDSATIVLDHSKYVMNENEKINYLPDNEDIDSKEDTIVLKHSEYVMTEAEKETYTMNERLEQAKLEENVIVPTITFEDRVDDEVMLPHSELFCDDAKLAVYHPDSNYYECV